MEKIRPRTGNIALTGILAYMREYKLVFLHVRSYAEVIKVRRYDNNRLGSSKGWEDFRGKVVKACVVHFGDGGGFDAGEFLRLEGEIRG